MLLCCWVESVSIPPQNSLAQNPKTHPLSNNPIVQRQIHRDDQYIVQTDRDPVGLLKCCYKAKQSKMEAFLGNILVSLWTWSAVPLLN